MKTLFKLKLALIALFFASNVQAATIYVNKANVNCAPLPCTYDGLSWGTAFDDLQDALLIAGNGDEIWIAKGTYYPTSSADRTVFFNLPSGVSIYGGFVGNEPSTYDLSLRDLVLNETILSGDIDEDDLLDGQNSYTVIFINDDLTQNILLDGLTVTMGYSNVQNGNTQKRGGAIYSRANKLITIQKCIFNKNYAIEGGAIYNSAPIKLNECQFLENESKYSGGAIFNFNSSIDITNSSFVSNKQVSTSGMAAGVFIWYGTLKIVNSSFLLNDGYRSPAIGIIYSSNSKVVNCAFDQNSCYQQGVIYFQGSTNSKVINCSFNDNTSQYQAANYPNVIGTHSNNGSLLIANSIFWDNTGYSTNNISLASNVTVEDCIVENGWAGTNQSNILTTDPLWINADLELDPLSPAIDAGVSSHLTNLGSFPTDIDGDNRFQGLTVDLGAQEGAGCFINAGLSTVPSSCGQSSGQAYFTSLGGVAPHTFSWSTGAATPSVSNLSVGSYAVSITDALGCSELKTFNILPINNGAILYVDENSVCTTGCVQDGLSWATAFTNLQDALNAVSSGICGQINIWVAAGTYYPTNTTDRNISFVIPSGVSIYGGFVGSEPSTYDLSLRDLVMNETVLSGDIGQTGVFADNSYTVVYSASTIVSDILLDGLIIDGGNANGSSGLLANGGGAYFSNNSSAAKVRLVECVVSNSFANSNGGGVYSLAKLEVDRTQFIANKQNLRGGGLYQKWGSVKLTNSVFKENYSGPSAQGVGLTIESCANSVISSCLFEANDGFSYSSIMYFFSPNAEIVNSIFRDNIGAGGTILSYRSNNTNIRNCSFFNNTQTGANALTSSCIEKHSTQPGIVNVYNSIFWDNSHTGNPASANYEIMNHAEINVHDCIVEGGWAGPAANQSNVISADPLWTGSNLDLQFGSPAIDAGLNAYLPSVYSEDFDGDTRLINSTSSANYLDMGAQEFQSYYKMGASEDDQALTLFPNPTHDFVKVSIDFETNYQVFDVAGKLVLFGSWNEGTHTLDMSQLQSGIYHLVTETDNKHTSVVKL